MSNGECFRASVIAEAPATHTAFVYDFAYQDQTGGAVHIDTSLAAGDFQTLIQADLLAILPSNITIRKYRFACVSGPHIKEVGTVDDVGQSGAISAGSGDLPFEQCISIKRTTGFAGGTHRGRIFFSPVAATFRLAQNGVNAGASDLETFRDLLKADLTTSGEALTPIILPGNPTTALRKPIIHVAIATTVVHRVSRRPRLFV